LILLAATEYVYPAAKVPVHFSLIVTSHWLIWHSSSSLSLSGAVTSHLRNSSSPTCLSLLDTILALGHLQTTKLEGAQQTSCQHVRSYWYLMLRSSEIRLVKINAGCCSPQARTVPIMSAFCSSSSQIPLQSFKPTSNPRVDSRLLGMPER